MPEFFDSTAAFPMKTKRSIYASGGRVGFSEAGAVTGEIKCIMNDVEKTRADLKSRINGVIQGKIGMLVSDEELMNEVVRDVYSVLELRSAKRISIE